MNRQPGSGHKMAIFTVIVVCAVFGTLTYVGAQSIAPPNSAVIPVRPLAALSTVPTPAVPELGTYVANKTAAIALGKALFWDMQVGSDGVQACASCHFNAGADSRTHNSVSPGIKAGDSTFQLGVSKGDYTLGPNYQLNPGTSAAGFGGYHDGDWPLHKQGNVDNRNNVLSDINDVIGSQGVMASSYDKMKLGSGVDVTTIASDQVFSFADPADPTKKIDTRRVTPRNTPTAVNAVFNYRNFWDGRARNVCNGANPFGDRDTTSHFFSAPSSAIKPAATLVRLSNSALCSQALGPAMSDFEMSASGRNFRELGKKLFALNPLQNTANTTPLGKQTVDPTDSQIGFLARHTHKGDKGLTGSYEQLVQAAFKPQWWQSRWHICIAADGSETLIDPKVAKCQAGASDYKQVEYNFSVFWGIAIQMYESTLRADQTPLDQYLLKQKTYTIVGNNVNNGYSFVLPAGIDPYTVSLYALNLTLDASDQDVFAFDDGFGHIIGTGVTQGTINYATGLVTLIFDLPPTTTIPVKLKYSIGAVPLSQGELRGLQIFQTKGKCIACHGGPELTNASVGSVDFGMSERMLMGDLNIRVYDNGFYNIGVRPAVEDIGVGDVDGVVGRPLSESADLQSRKCDPQNPNYDPTINVIITGRPGEFIFPAPLNCFEQVARNGNMKVPGLRNVALTAPYFHNGGQLTLEQVVEFYDRGGDFPDGFIQLPLMDSDVVPLGFTDQEAADLVSFLRGALTDPRVVKQQAPFDHPELFLPNGHPSSPTGYPVVNDPKNPGHATDQPYPMLMIPAVGRNGGAPLKTFLENMLAP